MAQAWMHLPAAASAQAERRISGVSPSAGAEILGSGAAVHLAHGVGASAVVVCPSFHDWPQRRPLSAPSSAATSIGLVSDDKGR